MGYLCLIIVSAIMGAAISREVDFKREEPKHSCLNCEYRADRDRNNCKICKRAYMDYWKAKGDER